MKSFFSQPLKLLDGVESFLGYMVAVLLSAMVVIMFASVIWRYVLNAPIVWADQLSGWIFVWMTYLGIAVGYRRGIHIGVDDLVRKMPEMMQFIVANLVDLSVGIFLIIVVYQGYGIVVRSLGQVYGALELPPSYMYAAAPVSCAIMLVFMLDSIKTRIARFISSRGVLEAAC